MSFRDPLVLLGLVAIPLGAAALGFWPTASGHWAAALRHRIRQVLALVLLLGLYVPAYLAHWYRAAAQLIGGG